MIRKRNEIAAKIEQKRKKGAFLLTQFDDCKAASDVSFQCATHETQQHTCGIVTASQRMLAYQHPNTIDRATPFCRLRIKAGG
mgnify:FL=1